MAPPSATQEPVETGAAVHSNENDKPAAATHEPGLSKRQVDLKESASSFSWPSPPKFEDKYEERKYQKGRLALAFRIFAKLGFDEGVAGHITLRVSFCTLGWGVLNNECDGSGSESKVGILKRSNKL